MWLQIIYIFALCLFTFPIFSAKNINYSSGQEVSVTRRSHPSPHRAALVPEVASLGKPLWLCLDPHFPRLPHSEQQGGTPAPAGPSAPHLAPGLAAPQALLRALSLANNEHGASGMCKSLGRIAERGQARVEGVGLRFRAGKGAPVRWGAEATPSAYQRGGEGRLERPDLPHAEEE